MRNAGLEEAQAGILAKLIFAGRNINNLRYADDTSLMAESKEELKSLLMKLKEKRKSWLKTQHSENKDHGIWSHQSWQTDGETVTDFILGGSKTTADGDHSHGLSFLNVEF